ncbi:hypothetical protein BH09ACT10_BH09ACT10_20460 [soil metagenome]
MFKATSRRLWLILGVAAIAAIVVVFIVTRSDDKKDASADPTSPTAQASEPVSTPSATATPTKTPGTTPQPTALPTTGKPVDIKSDAPLPAEGSARVLKVESVTSKAKGPGEISGPAVRVTLEITAGDKAVSSSQIAVNAYYGKDATPAIPMTRPGGAPFEGTIKAGSSKSGVYLFNVPKNHRDDLTVELYYAGNKAPVRFTGDVR